MGLGKGTIESFTDSNFGDFMDTLLGIRAGGSYRDSLSSYKESNSQFSKEMNLTGFKELVTKNKKSGETSNFKAYDRVMTGLLEGCVKSSSYGIDDSILKELDDGDQEGILKKANKIDQIFSELMKKNDFDTLNKVFVWAFSSDGGKLLGSFGKNQLPNEEVLLHFKNLGKRTEYQDHIGSSGTNANVVNAQAAA